MWAWGWWGASRRAGRQGRMKGYSGGAEDHARATEVGGSYRGALRGVQWAGAGTGSEGQRRRKENGALQWAGWLYCEAKLKICMGLGRGSVQDAPPRRRRGKTRAAARALGGARAAQNRQGVGRALRASAVCALHPALVSEGGRQRENLGQGWPGQRARGRLERILVAPAARGASAQAQGHSARSLLGRSACEHTGRAAGRVRVWWHRGEGRAGAAPFGVWPPLAAPRRLSRWAVAGRVPPQNACRHAALASSTRFRA